MTPTHSLDSERSSTLDRLFTAVSHPARRRILLALSEDNPRTIEEFESARVRGDRPEGATLAVELHHQHLPQLAEADFINWDRSTDTITKGPAFEEIQPLLAWIREESDEHTAIYP